MEIPQNLTDEIVNIWDLTEMDLVYQYPLLMHMESGFPADYQLAFGNIGIEQFQHVGFQQYVLEPSPSFYLAPISDRDVATRFLQNQNEDIRIHFTNEEVEQKTQQIFQKKDCPELLDVKKVSENTPNSIQNTQKNNDEHDDDVIFVKEYRSEQVLNEPRNNQSLSVVTRSRHVVNVCTRGGTSSKQDSVRRNPSRQARNSRSSQKLAKEHFLEGDFAFLDESDEEDLVPLRNNPTPSTSPASTSAGSTSSNENFKVWPTNVYERPEYNPKTDDTEPFDYTIREIQKSYVKRKPRLETIFKSKPKKRYFIRKRKPKEPQPIEKVNINEIEEAIRKTHEMFREFCNEQGEQAKKFEFLLKNQSVLVGILDDFKEIEISDVKK